ncbi:FtsX-like permease family protein [Bombilactobacillus bombi]|uniref:FtsX-like permease family protein n=1 Tax=Bombilactobacillus bombi TaxID=1303590 RepID=UPI0035EAEFB7
MIYYRLAWSSLKRNKQQYGLFVFASAILVALNFIFLALIANTSLKNANGGNYIVLMSNLYLRFVLMLSVIFMFYVDSFIMKQRNQELGLFNILGLTRSDLRLIIIIEDILLYLGTIILGLLMGVSFLKLAFLSLQKLMQTQNLHEQFSRQPFLQVIGIFAFFFILILIYNLFRLRKVKPIDLWGQAAQGERQPKNHWILAILGVLTLAAGYFIAVTVKPRITSFTQFTLAVILVVIGTYFVFIAASISMLQFLKNRKQFYYQPNHFISISGMFNRMKQNGAGLASICLLCTTILVTMIATISIYQGGQDVLNSWNPYDIMMTTKQPLTVQNQQTIKSLAKTNQIRLGQQQQMAMTEPTMGNLTKQKFQKTDLSTSTCTLSTLTIKDYNRIQHQHVRLKANELLIVSSNNSYQASKILIKGHQYQIRPVSSFKLYFNYERTILKPIFIIAANQKIAQQINPQPWILVNGINITGQHQKQFVQQLQSTFKLDESFSSRSQLKESFNNLFGGFLFLSIIACISMLLVTVLMIYYKQVAEGYADRERFQTMQQVGLSKQETRQAIHSQVLLVFMLPIIGATVNIAFALPAISSILKQLSLYNDQLVIYVALSTLGIMLLAYLAIYGLTTKVYERLVHAY